MKRTKVGLVITGVILAIGLTTATVAAPDQEGNQPSEKIEKGQPFNGKIEAVDTTVKTFTVGTSMYYVTDATKLTKEGKAIKLADLKVGQEVHGTSRVTFDGKTEAITLKVGAKDKEKDYQQN